MCSVLVKFSPLFGDHRLLKTIFMTKTLKMQDSNSKFVLKWLKRCLQISKIAIFFNKAGVNCSTCKVELTQNHLTLCPSRSVLKEGLDMSKFDDIVTYFKRYLTEAKKAEKKAGS